MGTSKGNGKYIETPEILMPELEFSLPLKKDKNGMYKVLPNSKFINGKNALRTLAASKVKLGYVYLLNIQGTTKYKIGVSISPKKRIADIASVIPYQLEVLALNQINNPYEFEQSLIDEFKHKLIRNEWFNLSIDEVKYIMVVLHNQQVKESIYG